MKLAFSTIGCPNWTFDEIFAAAKDLGYNAVEVRGLGHEIYVPKIKEFSDFYIDSTMQRLANAGLTVSMFTSDAVVGNEKIKSKRLIILTLHIRRTCRLCAY